MRPLGRNFALDSIDARVHTYHINFLKRVGSITAKVGDIFPSDDASPWQIY